MIQLVLWQQQVEPKCPTFLTNWAKCKVTVFLTEDFSGKLVELLSGSLPWQATHREVLTERYSLQDPGALQIGRWLTIGGKCGNYQLVRCPYDQRPWTLKFRAWTLTSDLQKPVRSDKMRMCTRQTLHKPNLNCVLHGLTCNCSLPSYLPSGANVEKPKSLNGKLFSAQTGQNLNFRPQTFSTERLSHKDRACNPKNVSHRIMIMRRKLAQ